jgi:hypothetical protein
VVILLLVANTAFLMGHPREDPFPGTVGDELLCQDSVKQRSGSPLNALLTTPVVADGDGKLDLWPHEGDVASSKDGVLNYGRRVSAECAAATDISDLGLEIEFTKHDQLPKIHDLLRLDLGESLELQFIDVARGAKSGKGSAVIKVGGSAAAGERMTTSMLALMFAASAADLVSTEYALASGRAAEGNPLMQSRPLRITMNLAVPFVAYLLTRENPHLGKWVCIVHVGVRGTITARNIYTGMTVRWK